LQSAIYCHSQYFEYNVVIHNINIVNENVNENISDILSLTIFAVSDILSLTILLV
jgi:hypothetical protein